MLNKSSKYVVLVLCLVGCSSRNNGIFNSVDYYGNYERNLYSFSMRCPELEDCMYSGGTIEKATFKLLQVSGNAYNEGPVFRNFFAKEYSFPTSLVDDLIGKVLPAATFGIEYYSEGKVVDVKAQNLIESLHIYKIDVLEKQEYEDSWKEADGVNDASRNANPDFIKHLWIQSLENYPYELRITSDQAGNTYSIEDVETLKLHLKIFQSSNFNYIVGDTKGNIISVDDLAPNESSLYYVGDGLHYCYYVFAFNPLENRLEKDALSIEDYNLFEKIKENEKEDIINE